jgi:outer membrane biosynthesis protein TonB
MFGFIKKLFGGIFSFLGNLFGFKKSEYYLELDESKGEQPAAKPAPAPKAEPAKVEKQESAPAPAPAPKAEPAKEKKTSSKKAKKTEQPTPAAPAAAYNGKVMSKEEVKKTSEAEGGFADRYLVPAATTPRRRPGANMNSYLDMARNMQMASK